MTPPETLRELYHVTFGFDPPDEMPLERLEAEVSEALREKARKLWGHLKSIADPRNPAWQLYRYVCGEDRDELKLLAAAVALLETIAKQFLRQVIKENPEEPSEKS